MWLPTPIYERIPLFWFVLGLLFASCALYIGLDSLVMVGYAGLGIACWAYGASILVLRKRYRNRRKLHDETIATFV